jgi:hypothetical protein
MSRQAAAQLSLRQDRKTLLEIAETLDRQATELEGRAEAEERARGGLLAPRSGLLPVLLALWSNSFTELAAWFGGVLG